MAREGMSDESKAREWTVKYFNGANVADGPCPEIGECVKVIEYSAYTHQMEFANSELERLHKAVEVMRGALNKIDSALEGMQLRNDLPITIVSWVNLTRAELAKIEDYK